jgi:dUTPase
MTNHIYSIINNLFGMYDRVMILKLFVAANDNNLYEMYISAANTHNNKIINDPTHIDAGFDLFSTGNTPDDDSLHFSGLANKLDLKVCCSARMVTDSGKNFNTGYYMYPRSSLSKTQLRLANSVGIIDAGYRGHLMGMLDVLPNMSSIDYIGRKYDRYLQICAPGLVPIVVEIVTSMEELGDETQRGAGGFGSSGR